MSSACGLGFCHCTGDCLYMPQGGNVNCNIKETFLNYKGF